MTARPFRFGTTSAAMATRRQWRDTVAEIADLGFDVLSVMDHLGAPGGVWVPLAVAHEVAPDLRLATMVLNNDLWNPAVLAREAISCDVLTDGRLELGVGAGWSVTDYQASGIARRPPSVRIARLAETIEILTAAFSGVRIEHAGEHYTIDGGKPWPRPAQPHLPLMIGGGSQRVLSLAAERADIVSIHRNMQHSTSDSWSREYAYHGEFPDSMSRKVHWVKEHAGDRFGSIELHALILKAVVTDDAEAAVSRVAAEVGVPEEHVRSSPHFAIGTPKAIAENLRARRESWGISYWTLAPGNDVAAFGQVVSQLAGG